MSRRSPVALALVVLALLALAPAAAAAPAVRLFAFAWGAERAADGSWGDIPSGGKRIIVQASSTEECRSLELEVLESPRPLAAGEIFRNATNAEWEFRVSAPVVGPDVYRFKVRCIYALIATAESSESRVEVQRYAPPPAPTPANTRTGAKKGGKGTRNGAAGASSRGGLRALATGIDLVDAFAARDLIAARLHLLLGSLPAPAGAVGAAVTVGTPPALPALPAGLAAAQATAVRAALANLDAQVALGRAAVESLARFAAADEAGDAATARRQALATADLLERWSGAIGDDGSLRGDAQAAIASLGLPTVTLAPEDATALRALAARGALPAGLGAALDAAGATAEERAVAANALGAIEASAVQAYRPTIEATPSDLIDEAAAARELRELAAFLRAGSATTVPPNGPAQATGTGQLRRLGCVGDPAAREGCARGRSMAGAKFIDVSPDGRSVYVSSIGTDSLAGGIAVYARERISGRVRQLGGKRGCLSATLPGCTRIPYSTGLSQLRVSPDGRFVYAALTDDRVIAILRRAPVTGALTWVGCVGQARGCAGAPVDLADVKNITISADGTSLYASARGSFALAWLRRAPRTGRLAWGACYGASVRGCQEAPVISPNGTAVTPDGRFLLVADQTANAVRSFARAPGGALAFVGCVSGPNGTIWTTGCAPGVGISGPENVGIGADGRVWVGASSGDALVQLSLDAAGNPGMADVPGACTVDRVESAGLGAGLCLAQPGLGATYGVAVPADASAVYTASYEPGAVAAFTRQRDGRMALLGSCFGKGVPGCAPTKGLARSGGIALAPDERHVYVAAPDSSALTTFARRLPATLPAPAVARARIRKGRPVRLQLTCPAGPAWCVGRVVASSLRVGRRRIRLGQPTFAIRPGATLTVRLAQRSPRAGGRRVRLVARLRVQEPWGAVALRAVSLPTGR